MKNLKKLTLVGSILLGMGIQTMASSFLNTWTSNDGSKIYQTQHNLVVNNKEVNLGEYKMLNHQDRTYVPLRLVAEQLGEEINWDASSQSVVIGDYVTNVTADVLIGSDYAIEEHSGAYYYATYKDPTVNTRSMTVKDVNKMQLNITDNRTAYISFYVNGVDLGLRNYKGRGWSSYLVNFNGSRSKDTNNEQLDPSKIKDIKITVTRDATSVTGTFDYIMLDGTTVTKILTTATTRQTSFKRFVSLVPNHNSQPLTNDGSYIKSCILEVGDNELSNLFTVQPKNITVETGETEIVNINHVNKYNISDYHTPSALNINNLPESITIFAEDILVTDYDVEEDGTILIDGKEVYKTGASLYRGILVLQNK